MGTSGDTGAFAVNAIRLWWQAEGSPRYPHATRLLATCDAGGSSDCRFRLWKDQLAVLAGQTGLRIEVMHFPPGTFRERASGTRSSTACSATSLSRGRERLSTARKRTAPAFRRLGVTEYLLALQLRDYLGLPGAAVGVILGADRGGLSHATALIRRVLHDARITLPAAAAPQNPPRTPAELLAYASANGIPLTIPETRYTMPDVFRTRQTRHADDTPETIN